MNKCLATAAAMLFAAASANAQDPENYIKYRQAVMKAIGGHSGAASQIVRGNVSPEGALAMHAQALAQLNSDLTSLFPEGSDFGETRAKAGIWSDRAKFEQAASDAKNATAAFAEAVGSGDADRIGATFRKVGDACKGCHEDFRQKDD